MSSSSFTRGQVIPKLGSWTHWTIAVITTPIKDVMAHSDIGAGNPPKVKACNTSNHSIYKQSKQRINLSPSIYDPTENFTCNTTLLERTKTAPMRYMQPIIFCLSKMKSTEGTRKWASFVSLEVCIKLINSAPATHSNVPTIFTLLYTQLRLTFSSLNHNVLD